MKTITIDGEEVQISIQPSNARRTLDIEFNPGEITIKVPRGQKVDLDTIIAKRRDLFTRKYREAIAKIKLLDGDIIHIGGKPHKIETIETPNPTEPRVEIAEETLRIQTKENENPLEILKKWITEQTRRLIQDTLQKYEDKLGTILEKTRIQYTAKWGECTKKGYIAYNWQLFTLPPELAEYVIIHEVVHLQHFHHQKGFHRKLEQLLPDHRQHEKNLQRYLAIPANFPYKR
jgi:predicted metal-dependent hydrolase